MELSQLSVVSAVLPKRCSACEQVLPVAKFNKRKDSRDGRLGRCMECCYKQAEKIGRSTTGGRIPVKPFRKWLEEKLQFYEGSTGLLALATGLDERQVYRILHKETKLVALDVVDSALVTEGSTFLWELGYREIDFKRADKTARIHDRRSSV